MGGKARESYCLNSECCKMHYPVEMLTRDGRLETCVAFEKQLRQSVQLPSGIDVGMNDGHSWRIVKKAISRFLHGILIHALSSFTHKSRS